MTHPVVVWSIVGWIAVCCAPYVYALNDLITVAVNRNGEHSQCPQHSFSASRRDCHTSERGRVSLTECPDPASTVGDLDSEGNQHSRTIDPCQSSANCLSILISRSDFGDVGEGKPNFSARNWGTPMVQTDLRSEGGTDSRSLQRHFQLRSSLVRMHIGTPLRIRGTIAARSADAWSGA